MYSEPFHPSTGMRSRTCHVLLSLDMFRRHGLYVIWPTCCNDQEVPRSAISYCFTGKRWGTPLYEASEAFEEQAQVHWSDGWDRVAASAVLSAPCPGVVIETL